MATSRDESQVLVIGSAGVDIVGRPSAALLDQTSNPGQVRVSFGGVARNVAENLARLGTSVALITAVGDDPQGQALLDDARQAGINTDHVLVSHEQPTGAYMAILDPVGNLHLALDEMRVVRNITPEYLRSRLELFREASMVFVDANLSPRTLSTVIQLARRAQVPIAADPTSVALAPNLTPHLDQLWLITPNEAEAEALHPESVPHDPARATDAARQLVSRGVEIAIITMAEFGLVYATADRSGHVPAMQTEIADPTGASDALTAAVLFALLNSIPLDEAVRLGLSAAALTLRTHGTVRKDLSLELLYDQLV